MMDVDMDVDMEAPQPAPTPAPTVIVISEEDCHPPDPRLPVEYPIPEWVPPPTGEDNVHHQEEGSWIFHTWDEQTSTPESLHRFLLRWPPSRTPDSYCSWIAVSRGSLEPRRQLDLPGLTAAFQQLVQSKNVTVETLDQISFQYGAVVGKWLIFIIPDKIDDVWSRIASFLCLRLQYARAKVAPRRRNDRHVISVYTSDYTNTDEVMALREELRKAGITWKIGLKPDAYTHLGIYARNEWNIRPSRFYE